MTLGIGALAAPVSLGLLHPLLGWTLVSVELLILLSVLTTALYGSPLRSERAFRLLRWLADRPQPPAPLVMGQPIDARLATEHIATSPEPTTDRREDSRTL